MRFIDEASLTVKAGNGGNGVIAFRRERFRPKGGPCGGDGGRGGDVVLLASRNIGTLLDFRGQTRIEAKRGQDGRGSDCHGRASESVVVKVPVGTVVYEIETGAVLGDLTEDGQELVAAKGGVGGRGNMRFVTPSNRAPRKAEPGVEGESREIRLELKLLADVGLLGLPNVGKSTLVSRLSAAKPKIADYPFTTLVPNLGVVKISAENSFVMADIPGIIRGAADGAGLGYRFLRHVQRTATLLHMLAPSGEEGEDLKKDFEDLSNEVETFDTELGARPKVVALNKCDMPECRELEATLRPYFEDKGFEFFVISAATGEGLDPLKYRLAGMVADRKRETLEELPPD